MTSDLQLNIDQLRALALASAQVTRDCACQIDSYREWTRIAPSFPQAQMHTVGTLAGDPYVEATYVEYHPDGSNYWSPQAPVAIRHFPYNRCTVLQCEVCGRGCLSYVEAGGYYVEPRVRALAGQQIVDVAVAE